MRNTHDAPTAGDSRRRIFFAEFGAGPGAEPAAGADFHRRLLKRIKLEQVFCLESERVVSNDLVVRFDNRFLQLEPKRNQALGPKARVLVQQRKDGALRVVHAEREVKFREIVPAAPPAST